MSIFSIPETMMPDMSKIETMNREFAAALLPFGGAYPASAKLMAHPAGGIAAVTALSMGVASQAFGVWLGAMTGSMEAARQICGMKMPGMDIFGFGATWDDSDCDVDAARPEPKSPVSRAKSAAKTLMADIESASAHLAGATDKIANAVVGPVGVELSVKETKTVAKALRVTDEDPSARDSKILPEDFRRPRAIDRPGKADDLKQISGIGPKLEQVLNGLGVWTFAQIASWTAEEIAWVDDYLGFAGRIGRDEWQKQATQLAGQAG